MAIFLTDTQLLDWMTRESRVRWKVMGQSGKRILAYSLDPEWGFRTLREALIAAANNYTPTR